MSTPTCQTCKYFYQHYYLDSTYGFALDCGHCSHSRIKHCKPKVPACKHYTARTDSPSLPDRARVIQFLTTKVLERILEMELPPEIKEGE